MDTLRPVWMAEICFSEDTESERIGQPGTWTKSNAPQRKGPIQSEPQWTPAAICAA
jgi:hypothetical protein